MTDNLTSFLARNTKPYDPDTDDYRRSPFAQPIKAGRSGTVYNAHTYHTKVPTDGIVPYIKYYTNSGDVVLDPFCGSGMTGIASLMADRTAILNDLSPAAAHIAKNYNQPTDIKELKEKFREISSVIIDEFDWLYSAKCDKCGNKAIIEYTIWSDVFECGRCSSELVLWDLAIDKVKGQVLESFTCKKCGANWKKSDLKWLQTVPVMVNCEARPGR